MTKKIPLGVFALVDDDDQEMVSRYSWYEHSAGYAVGYDPELRAAGGDGLVLMHRLIMDLKPGDKRQVDHINRERLDNRRGNLRIAGQSSNSFNHDGNKRLKSKVLQSPYKGVHWISNRQRWQSQFRGRRLGSFDTDLEAAMAYDAAVREFADEYAYLNFPNGIPDGADAQPTLRQGHGRSRSTSKYRGVSFNNQKKKWSTQFNACSVRLCWFTHDEEIAARWYDVIATTVLKHSALLNFPGEPMILLPEKLQSKLITQSRRLDE